MTTPKVKWGILGTGDIAGAYAHALARSETGELIAVGSRAKSRAEAFGEAHKIWRCYGSYQGLVSDPEVQVIFIATLHPLHSEWTRRALEAGKHVLCTKPLCMNHAEALAMFGTARKAGVLLMEAFTYRSHPQTARLVELVKSGAVGEVRIIEAGFSNAIPFNAGSRLYCKAMGGGSILDVGCYPVSMARLLAGAARGQDFADPLEIKGIACFGKTGVDEMASAILKFPGDIFAEVASGMMVGRENWVRVFGTEGEMRVPSPWIPAHNGGPTKILLKHRGEETPQEIVTDATTPLFTLEADTFAAYVRQGRINPPAMSPEDSLGNMKTLDLWRKSVGLVYDNEKKTVNGARVRKQAATEGIAS